MSAAVRFLNGFAQALSAMGLYKDGHPQRERAIDAAYRDLLDLQGGTQQPLFTFLGEEVVFGTTPLRELRGWDWSPRLAQAGIQRLEFQDQVTREDFEGFLDDVLARLTVATMDTSTVRERRTSIKFGTVGIKGDPNATRPVETATIAYDLGDEADTIRWMHDEVRERGVLPLAEAEAVVRSLAVAMHGGRQVILPLLEMKEFDQYTTTHSLNVSVLAMGFAEFLGANPADVRAFGVAGLLHDIGKIRVPIELLTKPGKLSPDERDVIQKHPADGARVILASEEDLDIAAVVAFEHHIMLNGGGYPRRSNERACHRASNLVHVCDVYDALRTKRPYRDAWPLNEVLTYLEDRSGVEFASDLVRPFVQMIRSWEQATHSPETPPPAAG